MVRKRRWHKLKANKASQKPVHHLFVDVECKVSDIDGVEQAHTLWFGWLCYWRRRPERGKDTLVYRRFTSAEQFWDIALSYTGPKNPLYIVAHNTAYDLGILKMFDNLEALDFEMYSIYLGNLSVIMRWRGHQRRIVILDNCNYFTGSLASLGEAIGFPKMDVNPLTATVAEADPYCKRDVEILVKLWQDYYDFLEEHDLGCWGTTVPSQAFRAYRHRFMPHDIVIHADAPALELEREAYHGGRTSVFWRGSSTEGPFYKLDVNSMYPYVMNGEDAPCRFYGMREHVTIPMLVKKLKRFQVIARVTVNTDVPVYPVKVKGHLVHPVGRFETVLTTPEIQFALDHGHLERVHIVSLYEHESLFAEYVQFFYELKTRYKLEDNKPFYLMAKLYLNALYGKFGQKSEVWEPFKDQPPEVEDARFYVNHASGETWRLYRFGDRCWRARSVGEGNDSFPAIAAHVTAYARLYLWKLITKAGRENVYYCDTDSLIVNRTGLDQLGCYLDNARLGALKIEASSTTLEIVCPKHYRIGTVWKRKGIPAKAVALSESTFRCCQFPSFKTQGRQGPSHTFKTRSVVKHLTGKIYDGDVQDDGWVRPLDASVLMPEHALDDVQRERVQHIDAEVDVLRETLQLDHRTVFTLWDYRKSTFKQARDKQGSLVPLEYSGMDARATELGFSDLWALQNGVKSYLDTRRQIRELTIERELILYPEPSMDTVGEMEF